MTDAQKERLAACLRHHGCSPEWIAYAMPALQSEIDTMLVTTATAAHNKGVASVPSPSYSSSGGFDGGSFAAGMILGSAM